MARFKVRTLERRLYCVVHEVEALDAEHARELVSVGESDVEHEPQLQAIEYRLVSELAKMVGL